MSTPSFSEATKVFTKIGLLSFGGPAGQIALMHRVLVDEKEWLEEKQFLHALNFCMLLPGPEAMQLATYAGWLLHGVKGGLMAGLLFIVPGFFVMLALSAAYVFLGDQSWMAGLLFGLKAAVLALVLEALLRVSKRALKDGFAYALAIAAFIAIALLKLPFPLVVLAAALAGVLRHQFATGAASQPQPPIAYAGRALSATNTATTLVAWLGIWIIPLALLLVFDPGNGFFADAAVFFSKAATVTFGGAYAVLVYAGQQAVDVYGWLKPGEMATGLGLAETTPGPLILVLVFIAFVGGARLPGFDPLTGGVLGGFTALWFTFVPCFLWIFVGAPYIERLRHVQWLSAALGAVTAAVVGVIANLAVWFGLHVLFGDFAETAIGPFDIPVLDWSAFDWRAALIAVASGVALLRFHANLFWVLGGAALAGMAFGLFG
ncbi:MAG: chromate efflux transporter [Rhizobiaceae bacterium]